MKFLTVLAVVLTTAFSCVAQDVKGYYVTTSGQRVEGFFKDADFTDASLLQFKTSKVAPYHTFPADEAKEYGLGASHKFVKFAVKYDTASSYDDNITAVAEPQWKEDTVFLNVLINGNLTLYSYYHKGFKFFYSVGAEVPQYLVYKKYKDTNGQVAENDEYKRQLFEVANCAKLKSTDYNDLKYTKTSLTDLVTKYNDCKRTDMTKYTNEAKISGRMNLAVYGGIRNNSFGIENSDPDAPKTSSTGWAIGIEGALKVSQGGWEIFARLEYEKPNLETTGSKDNGYNILERKYFFDGSFTNFGVGPRYNIFLPNGRIYIDCAASISVVSGNVESNSTIFPLNSDSYTYKNDADSTGPAVFANFGAGYEFGEKIGLELRYCTNRNIIIDSNHTARLNSIGLNLRYTIL